MSKELGPVIEMREISKSFGSNPVLKAVDFSVEVGEVHALAGENGAGKSTLMKILQGVYQKDSGSIYISGSKVEITDTFSAKKVGIGMVFQEFSLIPSLTVAQNIFLTNEPTKYGLIRDSKAKSLATELFKTMEVDLDPGRLVESLPTALWQLTEIAKALAQDAKILIMDEPTAALGPHETQMVSELIDELKKQGLGIFLIEHDIHNVMKLCDRAVVMKNGQRVGTVNVNEVTDEDILGMIIMGKKPASAV